MGRAIGMAAGTAAAGILLALPLTAPAADELEEVVVTATRVGQSAFDQPVSISSVGPEAIRDGQLKVNLSEALGAVPGLLIKDRENYAQDLQISSRGFGAHTTFGVTGMRVYVDGIPSTQPDGQGQVSNVDLASAERVELLRGPFSALYGNSAGGVISIFTEDGAPGTEGEAGAVVGSYGEQHYYAKLLGEADGINYVLDAGDFLTDGTRPHAAANRGNFNGKVRFDLDDGATLTAVANAVNIEADDPLGLTQAQLASNPDQPATGAIPFDTRKWVNQEQFGLIYHRPFGDGDALDATAYGGHRAVTQFQAIPVFTQLAPQSPGGIIALENGYWGGDVHWTDRRELAGMRFQATAGVSYDMLDEGRRGYQNFIGSTLGVEGALRRNEDDQVYDVDQYAQLQLEPDEHWLLEAGLRNSIVPVTSTDHYIVPGNGNDSGAVTYRAVTPVGGVTWKLTPDLHLYVSYGRGFQTPTLDQLAYRSTNASITGLNLGLKASTSDNYEAGLKARLDETTRLTLAGFHIATDDELAVAANSFGRAVYQNVGRTTRDGLELGLDSRWGNGFGSQLAYSYLVATYDNRFTSCTTLPCLPVAIPAGNSLPGIPRNSAFGALTWRDPTGFFSAALEEQAEDKVYANDSNSAAAPFYAVTNLRLGFEEQSGGDTFEEFIRFDNLLDRRYAGSVIVNESNGRYFEVAPGRTIYAGITVKFGR